MGMRYEVECMRTNVGMRFLVSAVCTEPTCVLYIHARGDIGGRMHVPLKSRYTRWGKQPR